MAYKHTPIRVDIRCPLHLRYNPEINGPGAIRGACGHCMAMWEIYQATHKLKVLLGSSPSLGKKGSNDQKKEPVHQSTD